MAAKTDMMLSAKLLDIAQLLEGDASDGMAVPGGLRGNRSRGRRLKMRAGKQIICGRFPNALHRIHCATM